MARTKFRSRNPFRGRKKMTSKRRDKHRILEPIADRPTMPEAEADEEDEQLQRIDPESTNKSASAKKLSLFGVEVVDFDSIDAEPESEAELDQQDGYFLA